MRITLLEAAQTFIQQRGINGIHVAQGISWNIWPGQNAIVFKAEPRRWRLRSVVEDFINDIIMTCPGIPICRIERDGNRIWNDGIDGIYTCMGFCIGGMGIDGKRPWSMPPVIDIG
jgi:hypothetical protein